MSPLPQLSTTERREVSSILAEKGRIAAIKHLCVRLDIQLMTAKRMIDDWNSPYLRTMSSSEFPRRSGGFNVMVLVPGIFFLAGLVMLTICFFVHASHQQMESNGVKVTGKVVQLRSVSSGGAAPVFEFERNGESVQWQSPVSSRPPSYEVGETAELYVHSDDAHRVLVDDFVHRWLLLMILGGLGGSFCLAALLAGLLIAFS
jgi:hypothetical protein